MPSCEVQRTLVKSPPELWAELSDPASLAKHLGEFGEIRTVRVEPETAVEWEAQDVRGVVQLKASGWGTKVTLTAVRERAAEEQRAVAPEPSEPEVPDELTPSTSPAAGAPDVETEPQHLEAPVESEPQSAEALTKSEPPLAESESASVVDCEPAAERRPGLFARLFRRRRKAQPTSEPPFAEEELAVEEDPTPIDALALAEPAAIDELVAVGDPATIEQLVVAEVPVAAEVPLAVAEPASLQEPEPEPTQSERPDLATELAQVEQAMVDQDTALLTAVLDRLGAAHHRPFSRG